MSSNLSFDTLFCPQSIVVIGSHVNDFFSGEPVLRNLLASGFKGPIYAVVSDGKNIPSLNASQNQSKAQSKAQCKDESGNSALADALNSSPDHSPNHSSETSLAHSQDRLENITFIPELTSLSKEAISPDLAYICCTAADTISHLQNLVNIGTLTVVIASPGFSDIGRQGAQLETEIAKFANANGMTILGPNSQGFIRPAGGLYVTDSTNLPPAGSIGFFSQSRSFFSDFVNWSEYNNMGLSTAVSLGNKAVITEADILGRFLHDKDTTVISGYIEEITDGQRFLDIAHSVTRKKPVILMRSGRTSAGARAAASFSDHGPDDDIAYEAAFRQTGIIRVNSMADLFVTTATFAGNRLPSGPGVGILTNSGASSIIVADAIENTSLTLASLGVQTFEQLSAIMPPYASLYNPVDLTDMADHTLFARATEILLNDPSVQSLFIPISKTYAIDIEQYCTKITEIAATTTKPIVICLAMTEQHIGYVKSMREAGITCLPYPEIAMKSLERLYKYAQWLDGPYPVEVLYRRDLGRAQNIIREAFNVNQAELTDYQAYDLLRAYEMPVLETKLARTSNDAVQIAKQIGYPVVLKIASPHISNKRDIHGIRLGLNSPDEVRKAFLELTNKAMQIRKDAYIAGCLVQTLAPIASHELTIGFKRNKSFGPIVYFGLSGRRSPSYRDFSCRVAPLSLHDAPAMVKEIRSFPLLAGMAKEYPIKVTAIEDIILILSTIAVDFPEIREIVCDPVLADKTGAYVAGLRVLLDDTPTLKMKNRAQSVL